MMDKIFLGFGAVLNTIAVIFFCASIGAVSFHYDTLQAVNWVTVSDSGTKLYVGFRAIGGESKIFGETFTDVQHITDCSDTNNNDACTKCGGNGGKASMALLAVALAFSVLGLMGSIGRFADTKNVMMKGVQLIMLFICFVFGIAAFSNYAGCYNELQKDFPKKDVTYGPGYGLDVCASFLVFIAFALGCITCGDGDAKEPAPAANPVVNKPEPVPTTEVEPAQAPPGDSV